MTVAVGVVVSLSCFKVEVPCIAAIKQSRCGREEELECQGREERQGEIKREEKR